MIEIYESGFIMLNQKYDKINAFILKHANGDLILGDQFKFKFSSNQAQ